MFVFFLNLPQIFDRLREECPDVLNKVRAIEVNFEAHDLKISQQNKHIILDEVNVHDAVFFLEYGTVFYFLQDFYVLCYYSPLFLVHRLFSMRLLRHASMKNFVMRLTLIFLVQKKNRWTCVDIFVYLFYFISFSNWSNVGLSNWNEKLEGSHKLNII